MIRGSTLWLLAAVLMQSGCATMEKRDRMTKLEDSLNAYGNALRWGRFEEASQYRVDRDKKPYPPRLDLEDWERLKVVSYEILRQAVDDTASETVVGAVIRYYRDDVGRVETLRDEQLWWYDDEQERWFLDGDLPRFPVPLRPGR